MDWRDRLYYPAGWEADMNKLTMSHDDVIVHCDAEVCPGCHGKGMCVNPSVDREGITSSDFDSNVEWIEFKQEYMDGAYDIVCPWCKGLRVVLMPQADDPNLQMFRDDQQGMYDSDAERDAERRMGA